MTQNETEGSVSLQDVVSRREHDMELKDLGDQLRGAYRERAHLVALLAALYPEGSSIGATDSAEPDWPVVTIRVPEGQLSWHIAENDLDLFQHVWKGEQAWDGHDTNEKYRRLRYLTRRIAASDPLPHRGVGQNAPGVMGFDVAVQLLKTGRRVARSGWNGDGMYVVAQAGYTDGIPINANTARATGLPEGTVCNFLPYLMMWTAQGAFVPWVASQSDILAEDWGILS